MNIVLNYAVQKQKDMTSSYTEYLKRKHVYSNLIPYSEKCNISNFEHLI